MMQANREVKDSVFSLYMTDDPTRLIEVYNAIQGTSYPLDTPIEITTLQDALYKNRVNDVSFLMDNKFIVLLEHQSTINHNMPLRLLLYYARLLEKSVAAENIYKRGLIPIAAPEFFVLYNGTDKMPDWSVERLSDAYIEQPTLPSDFSVRIVNINHGHSAEIMEKSTSIAHYSLFISYIRQNQAQGMNLGEAIHKAVLMCQEQNIMQPFLIRHASEVENMLFTEWNWEQALQVAQTEGHEEGLEEGRAEGLEKGRAEGIDIGEKKKQREMIQTLLESLPIEQVASMLKISVSEVEKALQGA